MKKISIPQKMSTPNDVDPKKDVDIPKDLDLFRMNLVHFIKNKFHEDFYSDSWKINRIIFRNWEHFTWRNGHRIDLPYYTDKTEVTRDEMK